PREKAGETPSEHVRREVDQHVAHHDVAAVADGKELAPHLNFFLCDPAAAALRERAGERRVPFRFRRDRKSTRLNSSHGSISYAVFCLKKKMDSLDDHAITTTILDATATP